MLFHEFSQFLEKIEVVSARLEMTAILAQLFAQIDQTECEAVFNLIQGQLLPPYQNLEFQLSERMVTRALARIADQFQLLSDLAGGAQAASANLFGEEDLTFLEDEIRRQVRQSGDIGLTAQQLILSGFKKQSGSFLPLNINQVYADLLAIARENGAGSQDRKLFLLQELLIKVDPLSARYIVRIIVGKMRLGFSLMTILDGMSWAMTGTKDESALLEDTFQKKADLAQLAQVYLFAADLNTRRQLLQDYNVEVGVPIVPALCQRLNSSEDIIAKMHDVYAEPKYDGMRIQIHFIRATAGQPQQIKAFTRNLEDVSYMFPELEKIPQHFPASIQSFILDSEAVTYDPTTDKLRAFQETITRKRKHEIDSKAESLPMRFFIFDVLALNGQSYLDQPLTDRKKVLADLFADNQTFVHTPDLETADAEVLRQYHHQELKKGLEGVVVKQPSSVYQPGRKGWAWVKIKEEAGTRGKLSDTLDLIVMGLYTGKGKRLNFGVGAFLVGILSRRGDEILSVSKIGTGLTDEQFHELKRRAQPLETEHQPTLYKINKALTPDIWLEPAMIVEIAADEITNSSLHTSGVSLRFPRLIRWRDDKSVDEATTLAELDEIKVA